MEFLCVFPTFYSQLKSYSDNLAILQPMFNFTYFSHCINHIWMQKLIHFFGLAKLTKSEVLATKGPDIQSAEQIMQSQVEAS